MHARHILPLLGAMAIAAPTPAFAQFEGTIKFREISVTRNALGEQGFDMSSAIFDVPTERLLALRDNLVPNGDMTIVETAIYIKGNLIRTDVTEGEEPGYATVDLASGTMRMFNPDEKSYMEMTKEDMERMRAMGGGMPMTSGELEVTATGITRTINGMTCTAYDVATDEGTTRVWVSKDNPELEESYKRFSERMQMMNMGDEVDEEYLVAKHGFPVLTQRLTYSMYEINEVMSVERKAVSNDLFEPPAGWRKMTMADMMRGNRR